jgi:preprotein translocase subunit SecD
MRPLFALAVGFAACLASDGRPCAAEEAGRVLVYRAADAGDLPERVRDVTEMAAGVITKRCAHAGFEGVAASRAADGRLEVKLPATLATSETAVRGLIERRGDVKFRLRAETAMEDEWRDRRLQAGAAPPDGYAWVPDAESPLQALVETPEAPYAAKLSEAIAKLEADKDKTSKDHAVQEQAAKDAYAALREVSRESVFSNIDIAAASVQRTISTIGALALMHRSVRFEFKEDRRAAFEKFTGDHVGRTLCVVVEGKVQFAPVIRSALPGAGEIRAPGTGYTEEEAKAMAALLECGPLPCRLVAEKGK